MDCSICIEHITNDQARYVSSCNHGFHYTCIQKYDKASCPNCRAEILDHPGMNNVNLSIQSILKDSNFSLKVHINIAINDLKERISAIINIPSNLFKLWLGTERLDENLKLNDYDINLKSTVLYFKVPRVELPEQLIQVFIMDLNNKTYTYKLSNNSLVIKLKEMIQTKQDISINRQRLIHSGRQLEDDKTLREYGIQNDNTLHLVLRLRGC